MQLKSKPDDFIVEELSTLNFIPEGKFSYYKLKKTNVEINAALQQIASHWKINQKYINIAGNKDKTAVTTQYISISQGPKENMKTQNLELLFLGSGKQQLQLGMLDGNRFAITVREITEKEKQYFLKNLQHISLFVNYYDDQRFGNNKNNHIIGRHLVRKEFKEACALICAVSYYPHILVQKYLNRNPTDVIGALRTLPKKLLLLFVHAYQSWLWNECAQQFVLSQKKHKTFTYNLGNLCFSTVTMKQRTIPIIGFDIECDDYGVTAVVQKIMKQEKITSRDFLPKQMPELLTAGGKRDLLISCSDFSYEEIDKETLILHFALGKGSYATMIVKQLFA